MSSANDETNPIAVPADADTGADVNDDAEAKAETARAQAEARRKRILEKANKRLGVVSGEEVVDEEYKKVSASNAARIRAARQRRYGKKSAAAEETSASAATETTKNDIDDSPATTTTETKDVDSTTTAVDIATASSKEKSPKGEVTDSTTSVDTSTIPPPSEGGDATGGGKKKYVGVAKMRRKMIAKKKLEEEAEETTATTAAAVAGGGVDAATAVNVPLKIPVVPVYMHILTIVLLFLAGLDVGLQQYHDDVVVHPETAIKEYGIPFVQRKPWQPLTPLSIGQGNDVKRTLQDEYLTTIEPKGVDQDEFEDDDGKDEEEYVPNIDPIFRVDLDELTKGPGVLNTLARGAVAVHRMILWLVYYTPISFFRTLLSIPMALMKMPPALFLIALVLRQIVGKMVLGANIPERKPGDGEEKNNIEILSVAKNFIKNFLTSNFPTIFALYDALVHLRSDMYIVICGVFCGLAWSHLVSPSVDVTASGGRTLQDDPTATAGGTDEL
jgi:hypothetical protein